MADKFRFGSWATSTPAKVITLHAGSNANNYTTFRKTDGSSYSPVTTGFVITHIVWSTAGSTGSGFLGYADNNVGFNGAVPTNKVSLLGEPSLAAYVTPLIAQGSSGTLEFPCYIGPTPIGKFLWIFSAIQETSAYIEGYEV